MSVTYKGPDGRLYRVSDQADAEGRYYIEYRDPAGSAVYKPLPGQIPDTNRDRDRDNVVAQLGDLVKTHGLVAVEDKPAATEKPKGTGVWLYGDHRAMRVGVGSDTDRSDCRCYHVLVLNLLADKPRWRKLSGAGNYDHKHLADADAELRETLPEDAYELTVAETEQLFSSPATGWFDLNPDAVKVWDKIMAGTVPAESPAAAEPQKCRYAGTFTKDGLECLCDPAQCATIAKVKPGDDVPCLTAGPVPDCRAYYAGRIINDEGMTVWKSMNHDSTAQLREYVAQMDAKQSEVATVEMDGNAAIYQEEPALAVKSAESPASAPADAVSPRTEPAAIAVPPAADIAAPAFDFGADAPTNTALLQCAQAFVAGRLAQVMAAKRAHDLTADHYQGSWGKWCAAIGISRDTGDNFVRVAENFGNVELNGRPLVEVTPISLLAIASKPSAPLELKQGVESGDITTTKQYRELEAQLKAAKQAKETAERETREALAWKQHAEGQAEDAKAAIHEAKQTAQEAQRVAEALKQQIYRRNEELQEKDQELNAALDQQGAYVAKVQKQEEMLAELQDRLDEVNAQLRNPQLEATVVDQDELERRAEELASQKIAEALGAQERQPMCDLVMALNNTIENAWALSGIEDREPESKYDDRALEVLYNTACRITDWAAGRLEPDEQEVARDE